MLLLSAIRSTLPTVRKCERLDCLSILIVLGDVPAIAL